MAFNFLMQLATANLAKSFPKNATVVRGKSRFDIMKNGLIN